MGHPPSRMCVDKPFDEIEAPRMRYKETKVLVLIYKQLTIIVLINELCPLDNSEHRVSD